MSNPNYGELKNETMRDGNLIKVYQNAEQGTTTATVLYENGKLTVVGPYPDAQFALMLGAFMKVGP